MGAGPPHHSSPGWGKCSQRVTMAISAFVQANSKLLPSCNHVSSSYSQTISYMLAGAALKAVCWSLGKTDTHFVSRSLLSLTKFPINVEASMGDSGIKNGPMHCQSHLADHNLLRDGETGWSSALALILRSGWPWCWLSPLPLGTVTSGGNDGLVPRLWGEITTARITGDSWGG